MKRIVILGDGAWGTALALILVRKGRRPVLWSRFPEYAARVRERRENFRFLPGVPLPEAVEVTWGPPPEADLYVAAVPTQFLRETLVELRPHLCRRAIHVCVAKGLEMSTGRRPSEILREVVGRVRIVVLSGPSHAPELARRLPASVVAAGEEEAAREVQRLFGGDVLRVYTSRDALGVELGGALKNVIALAGGVCDGLGLGHNAKAALLTRGIVEMARLGVRLGARRSTFFGLSGIGDLIATTSFPSGRNLSVGRAVGAGKPLEEALRSIEGVAEGVWTVKAVAALARRHGVDMPITREVHAIFHEGKDPRVALRDLMSRRARPEED